jgi:hypothetical protein
VLQDPDSGAAFLIAARRFGNRARYSTIGKARACAMALSGTKSAKLRIRAQKATERGLVNRNGRIIPEKSIATAKG